METNHGTFQPLLPYIVCIEQSLEQGPIIQYVDVNTQPSAVLRYLIEPVL